MNAIIPQNFGAVSGKFIGQQLSNDLAAGVQTGFAIVGYKGKVWSLRYRGENKMVMRDDGDGPANSIQIVILKASSALSKIWYKDGYVEGSDAAPDCFSTNGVTPDMSSRNRQANTCAACPMNAWGSRMTPAGKAGKACSDSKRVAVVPLNDIHNEVYGGPMLLRVPAASLNDLASFGNKLHALGYPVQAVAVRIAFDPAESYPKFNFSAVRPLNDSEADAVLEMMNDPQVGRILAEGSEHATQVQALPSPETVFEQPPTQPVTNKVMQQAASAPAAPVQQAAPVQEAAPTQKRDYKKKPAAPAPAPVEEDQPTGSSFDDELDAQLNGLL